MANLQIRIDAGLKARAQAVVENMGIDLSSAIRVFLAQMVRENGFPFRPSNEPFFGEANQEALRISLAELQAGQSVTKSLEELRSLE